ncbi:MAG: hypothetical protein AUK17_01590 [Parcubacteria group bacterium CG2_30_44_18]|nr:MAG: hypothetical protein AUK17_01590 [Parcubacteria group bacterium CG2_30_44_18]
MTFPRFFLLRQKLNYLKRRLSNFIEFVRGKRRKGVLLFFLFIGFLSLVSFFWHAKPQICFNKNCFQVELAATPQERAQGLMYRNFLAADAGMLFVFQQEGEYPFWMKNTKIPLDMIWINKDREVVLVAKNVRPCEADSCFNIMPDGDALYVLEINAGLADNIGIKQGDRFDFEI